MGVMKGERVSVTFSGKANILAPSELTAAVAVCGAELVDLRQTVVQGRVTMAVELEVGVGEAGAGIYRALLIVAARLGLGIDFDFTAAVGPVEELKSMRLGASAADVGGEAAIAGEESGGAVAETTGAIVESNGEGEVDRDDDDGSGDEGIGPATYYVLTLLSGESISPHSLQQLADALAERQFSTEKISRLSADGLRCLELVVATVRTVTSTRLDQLRAHLYALGMSKGIDIALQAESVLRRSKRLVVMDMDSTLIQQEVIDELARHAGVYEQVQAITHRAMAGELDFNESLEQRVALLAGTPSSVFDKVIDNLEYTPGAHHLCKTLKRLGYRLGVISGGFTRVTEHVRAKLGLDYDYANTLEEDDNGVFTGRTVGPVVNAQRKADLLTTIAQHERITLDQVIAIGDGANDLPMLGTAGLGIAFNAKPAVQKAANFRINQPSLTAVLYLLGFSEQDQKELSGHGGSAYKTSSTQSARSCA